jgi:acetolactate synthase-1/2/3 large subunit
MKASDLFVKALENEGVDRIFAVPGEENLDVVESLRRSSIELIVTRHEQSAAFMAATHGRLTGRPGVCMATLGPGALNLVTGAAYAHLGAMPMVLITGQKPIMTAHQARFQIVDIVATMKPLTKASRQIVSGASIPTVVREAFRLAADERPGPVHLELPEDVAAVEVSDDVALVPLHPVELPVAQEAAIARAAALLMEAERPLVMFGAASNRPRLAGRLTEFIRRTGIPFFNTQMGKGTVAAVGNNEATELWMGTAALSARDYLHEAIDRADLIVAIGHDTVEKPPFIMGPKGPKVIHVGYTPAHVEQVFFPHAEVVGDLGLSLARLADHVQGKLPNAAALAPLREGILRRTLDRALSADAAAHRPRRPRGHAADGIVALDNGMYKIWFARNYRTASPTRCCSTMRWPPWVRPAVGDDGRAAVSGPARDGGVRRRRLHDEQRRRWRPRFGSAQSRGADSRGPRLRHDPLEAGRRRFPD